MYLSSVFGFCEQLFSDRKAKQRSAESSLSFESNFLLRRGNPQEYGDRQQEELALV